MELKAVEKMTRVMLHINKIGILTVFLLISDILISQVTIIAGSSSISKNSYTVGAGSNRLIVVTVGDENGNSIGSVTSITWGGVSLSKETGNSGGVDDDDYRSEIWYLDEAGIIAAGNSGTNNFVVTWTNGPAGESFHAVTLENVNQISPTSSNQFSEDLSASSLQLSSPLSVNTNDLIYYTAITRKNNNNHTPSIGYTELVEHNPLGNFSMADAYKQITTNGTEQPTATFPGSGLPMSITAVVFVFSTSALPIELLNFNAFVQGDNSVKLFWQTASEVDNDYFTVERSLNGFDWEMVRTLNGAGSSSSVLNYSLVDKNPYRNLSYYRLKQTDFDGKFEYSKVISVNLKILYSNRIQLYPNPTSNKIILIGDENELNEIKILNELGQHVSPIVTELIDKNTLTIDISNLNSGLYFIITKNFVNKVYKQ